jgi:hypothetical protein
MLYTVGVRRLLLLLAFGILVMDATGLEAFVFAEPCTSAQADRPDQSCPALCVRCACCAQPIVPETAVSAGSTPVRHTFIDLYSRGIPPAVPAKIFHVPKLASPAL